MDTVSSARFRDHRSNQFFFQISGSPKHNHGGLWLIVDRSEVEDWPMFGDYPFDWIRQVFIRWRRIIYSPGIPFLS